MLRRESPPMRKRRPIARAATYVLAALTLFAAALPAEAGRLGVVLMHAEQGSPRGGLDGLAATLEKAGHLVARPDMCWSARRSDEAPFEDCLAAVDAAIVRLRNLGATGIVVGGVGLGGTAAIVYAAGHKEVAGVVALAPGHDAAAMAALPEVARSVAKAQSLAADGKGDEEGSFVETGIGPSGGYTTEIATTANIYLSFFGPRSKAVIAGNIEHLSAPLLLVGAADDQAERLDASLFAKAPANKLSRHVTVAGGAFASADAARDVVKTWLDELAR